MQAVRDTSFEGDKAKVPAARGPLPIVVLGMHRSGTSALTGALHAMGALVGDEEELTGRSQENPQGFFERRDLRRICDSLLHGAGADWWRVSDFRPEAVPQSVRAEQTQAFSELATRLDAAAGPDGQWAIKEPRLCLLFPVLADVLDGSVCLLPVRNPVEVARSLRRRNGFSLAAGIALWEAYTLSAIAASAGRPRVTLDYAALVAEPGQTMERLAGQLNALGAFGLDPAAGAATVVADHWRERADDDAAERNLTPGQRALWEALRGGEIPDPPPTLPEASREVLRDFEVDEAVRQDLTRELRQAKDAVAQAAVETHKVREEVAEAEAAAERAIARANEVAGKRERQAAEAEAAVARLTAQRDAAEADRAKARAEAEATFARLTAQRDAAEADRAKAKRAIARLAAEGDAAKAEIALVKRNAKRSLDDAARALRRAQAERDRAQRAVDALQSSTSWRVTAPVRWAKRLVLQNARPNLLPAPKPEAPRSTDAKSGSVPARGLGPGPRAKALRPSGAKDARSPSPGAKAPRPSDARSERGTAAVPKGGKAAPAAVEDTVLPVPVYLHRTMRLAVYTAIMGGYDRLKLPDVVEPGCDYICFTDTPLADPGPWEIRGAGYHSHDPTRAARYVKTHPHVLLPDYDRSLWIDGNLVLKAPLKEDIWEKLEQHSFYAYVHPHRSCIYAEATELVARGGLDSPKLIEEHVARLRAAGYPEEAGLTESNVLARRHHDPAVRTLDIAWWREIANGSRRDQLSLNYVAWRQGFEIAPLAERGVSTRNDPRFSRVLHLKDADTYTPTSQALAWARKRPRPQRGDPYPHLVPLKEAAAKARAASVDVVICIHNSPDDVAACLASVAATRREGLRIVAVDDGSDLPTARIIDAHMAAHPGDVLVRHEAAKGYTRAANAGLDASSADYVILLNSDTIVPEGWADMLLTAGERLPAIGIVGPMSNAASWQSMPEVLTPEGDLAVNALPDDMTVSEVSALCARISTRRPILTHLVNGFCFALKRSVIEAVGRFDEESFPEGYGEENDFCLRAGDAGFLCAVATDVYVFHAKSKSFTHERRKVLSKAGSEAFRAKYTKSRVDSAILQMKHHPQLEAFRAHFARKLEDRVLGRAPTPVPDPPLVETRSADLPAPRRLQSTPFVVTMDADARTLAANAEVIEAFRRNPQTPLRSATWFLPGVPHIYRGGLYTIFRIADAFSRFGGTLNRFAIMNADTDLAVVGRQIERAFPEMRFELVHLAGPEAAAHLPPTDAGICTLWTTAYALLRFNGAAAKYYLVQDYEPAFMAAGSVSALAEQSYRFGFTGLCNTLGVAAKYQVYTDWLTYFTPAVDKTQYYPLETPAPGMQLVFYGRPANDRNAFLLGVEALKRVKAEMGDDISILSAGHPFREADYGLEGVLKNLGLLPDIAAVADVYRRSHIGLVFMYTPHPSYQPFEFMASGCATVTNFNESTRWLLKDGENALLCASTAAAVAERILDGARDEALRARVIAGGLETVSGLDWNRELKTLYDYVRAPQPRPEPIRT